MNAMRGKDSDAGIRLVHPVRPCLANRGDATTQRISPRSATPEVTLSSGQQTHANDRGMIGADHTIVEGNSRSNP